MSEISTRMLKKYCDCGVTSVDYTKHKIKCDYHIIPRMFREKTDCIKALKELEAENARLKSKLRKVRNSMKAYERILLEWEAEVARLRELLTEHWAGELTDLEIALEGKNGH